jgi:hypothetical protein
VDTRDKIIARVARALGAGDPVEGLARNLPPSDLSSLMLHVYRARSGRRTPAELLQQYERSALVRPSALDPRALAAVEQQAFAHAAGFEAIELAPIAPLGVNAVLGQIDQNNCLATVRNAEVAADPTTSTALECARRRRAGATGTIRLCARSRMLRLQPLDKPWFTPHFALFSLVSAGRDRGGLAFELESLREHLTVYLGLASAYGLPGVTVEISDTARDPARLAAAEDGVIAPLAEAFPGVALRTDRTREQGRSYYRGLCLKLDAVDTDGTAVNLADGGFTDWTQRLLANAKERLLVSGMGIELLVKKWTGPPRG